MKPYNRKLMTQSLAPLQPTTTNPSPTFDQSLTFAYPGSLVAALLAALVTILLMGCVKWSRWMCADSAAESSTRRGLRRPASSPPSDPPPSLNQQIGVDPATIRALPVRSFCGKAKYGQSDCAICLGEFEEKEAVKVIPFCKHVFHPVCIDTWLSSHVTCPVCRSTRFSVRRSLEDRRLKTMTHV